MTTLDDGDIRLRPWTDEDAEWYAATASTDEQIQRFTTESPNVTADEVRAAIHKLERRDDAVGFVICDRATGERLGNIALALAGGVGEVSYWLAASGRGRGAATSALRQLSSWAFDHLELDELRLHAHVDNVGSRRVAERAGFQRDPGRDAVKEVRGQLWDTVAYELKRQMAVA
jgi:ribosomal-protein-alanine N-acetyltransferase